MLGSRASRRASLHTNSERNYGEIHDTCPLLQLIWNADDLHLLYPLVKPWAKDLRIQTVNRTPNNLRPKTSRIKYGQRCFAFVDCIVGSSIPSPLALRSNLSAPSRVYSVEYVQSTEVTVVQDQWCVERGWARGLYMNVFKSSTVDYNITL